MASKINADEFVDREGEGKPTLPKGVVLSGVTTITTAVVAENEVANSTGINVGIITSTHFAGNLTGDVNAGIVTVTSQSVIGSAVTISASGIDIGAGVITATSYAGSGANLTGIGATIMTWEYNPDPYVSVNTWTTGIGITFNQKIKAGTGNITIRETNASGTVVENFGIGSSVTISGNSLTFTPTSSLGGGRVYYVELPSGVITNMAGDSYVGTAYTFSTAAGTPQLWVWGSQDYDNSVKTGILGLNNTVSYSSPVQLPGTTWSKLGTAFDYAGHTSHMGAIKTDGTLWTWGSNYQGSLGQNQQHDIKTSSPAQVGSDTTWASISPNFGGCAAVKTDGTLWSWGYGGWVGWLGENDRVNRSSPIQVPGFSGASTGEGKVSVGNRNWMVVKTNGELWVCGNNNEGFLGVNQAPGVIGIYSSPVQVPGTNWNTVLTRSAYWSMGGKTDGTLWVWGGGVGGSGRTGDNGAGANQRSSPAQVPGTDWVTDKGGYYATGSAIAAIKTDGSLWTWGSGSQGQTAQNDEVSRSSPIQVGTDTNWNKIGGGGSHFIATKTDGTLWVWGNNDSGNDGKGALGLNNMIEYSSPIQLGTDIVWTSDQIAGGGIQSYVMLEASP